MIKKIEFNEFSGTAWIVVHDGTKVLLKQYNDNQYTIAKQTIVEFNSEAEADAYISTNGLIPLPTEDGE